MTVPTVSELQYLRLQPHGTRLWLSIYQPEIALTATVSGSHAKGSRSISYDGASWSAGWSYNKINNGMTMLVGYSVGDESKGRIRVRSAVDGTLTVAENSHINWSDNDVLTILNFYEINAVYPRIIQDPGDETQTLWYKDYDIAYNGQNSALGSFICMGSHYAGFTGTVYYSASGTYNLKSESLSYHWLFEGGTPTGSSSHTPGNVTYTTPGHYTTSLIVSGTSAGAVDRSYRHISIYNRPESGSGAELPILSWELSDLSGSRDQGGYVADIRLHQNMTLVYSVSGSYKPIVREGDLVVIFAEDWYGETHKAVSMFGNSLNRSSIVFSGYISKGSIQYNYRDSYVDFSVGSPTEVMKQAEGFSISVQDNSDPETATSDPDIPSGWVTVLNMDLKRALYHYLRWHSTVMNCCDIKFIGTDRALQYFDADRTSIYDAISTLVKGAWLGNVSCDRQGALFIERDVYIEPTAFPQTFELSDADWMDDIQVEQEYQNRTSFIECGGVAYSGMTTGTYTALLSQAPGTTPTYRGRVEKMSGLALLSQGELNTIAGALYAQKNVKYPNVDLKLAGNYRNFDIAPQEKIPLTINFNDTVRGIEFVRKPFFLSRMQWSYDPKLEIFIPTASLTEMATGSFSADTVDVPVIPPSQGDSGGFYIPPIEIPKITIPPYPTVSVGGGTDFLWFEGTYGYTESDYVSQFIPVGFTALDYGYLYGRGMIPFGMAGSANVYAIVETYQAGDYVFSLQVKARLPDSSTATTYTGGPFTVTNTWGAYRYQTVGPVAISDCGGRVLDLELTYDVANAYAAWGIGFYVQF